MTWRALLRAAPAALWAPLAVLATHAILGARFGHEPWVDPIMHFSGGAAVALFFGRLARHGERFLGHPSRGGLDLALFGLVAATACAWELFEWALELLLGPGVAYDFEHTLRDVCLGLAGGALCLAALHFPVRARRG